MALTLPLTATQLAAARTYTLEALPQLSDSDPQEMSEYALGLLQQEHATEDALRQYVTNQLLDLLESHTESFVSQLWQHLQQAGDDAPHAVQHVEAANTESNDLYADIDTSTAPVEDIPSLEPEEDAEDDDDSDDRDRRRHDRYEDQQQQQQQASYHDQYSGQQQQQSYQQRNNRPQRHDRYSQNGNGRHQQQNGRHNQRQQHAHQQPMMNGQLPPPVELMQQMMQMQQHQQQQQQQHAQHTPNQPTPHSKPPPTPDATSLFATHIPPEQCTMPLLSQWFSMFGELKAIKVIEGGKADIQFTNTQHAAAAINAPVKYPFRLMWNKHQPKAAATKPQHNHHQQQPHPHQHQQQHQQQYEPAPPPQTTPKSANDVAAEIATRRQATATHIDTTPTPTPTTHPTHKRPQSPPQSDAAAKAEQLHALRQQLITKQVSQQKEMLAKLEANKATLTADEKAALMNKIKELSGAIKSGVAKQQQQQATGNAVVKKQRVQ